VIIRYSANLCATYCEPPEMCSDRPCPKAPLSREPNTVQCTIMKEPTGTLACFQSQATTMLVTGTRSQRQKSSQAQATFKEAYMVTRLLPVNKPSNRTSQLHTSLMYASRTANIVKQRGI
jgi:hypothetical protein